MRTLFSFDPSPLSPVLLKNETLCTELQRMNQGGRLLSARGRKLLGTVAACPPMRSYSTLGRDYCRGAISWGADEQQDAICRCSRWK